MNNPTPRLNDLSQGRGPLEQRMLAGKAMLQLYSSKNHATLAPIDDKRDPIALLEASNKGRLRRLIPVRYGRMLASPFAFYRGAAPIMAYDLGQLPRSGITV